jgi:predicted FMN-binding regulatory protein PaiB
LIEKLGQHKKSVDQKGVYKSLQASDTSESRALANYMKQRGLGIG